MGLDFSWYGCKMTPLVRPGKLAELPAERAAFMKHRHLNHQKLTLAAIDDVIARGGRKDWEELRQAVLADESFLKKILRVCRAHVADPRAQRYHFWKHYAEERSAA